ncbi:protein FAM3B [Rhinatrema bivittatum]|uniref:protein FAM3B n=1 Tax=Rhinatrema bivittatum TaxID=194408 RepID=UPI00112BBA79|nr:protein FAM3B [Rhinatrema bivittatum]
MLPYRFLSSNVVKAIALLLASTCAWYLGYLFAENLSEDTIQFAINNIQNIGERPVMKAPPPRRQKCDHWTACPEGNYAYRVLTGGGRSNLPKICFEDVMVIGEKNENVDRGLNIAVIDYKTGKSINTKSFDTYEKDVSGDVVKFLKDVPQNSIILIATHDEAANKLTEDAKKALEEFGSKEIRNLRFRSSWSFVSAKGVKLPDNIEKEKINHSDDSKNRYSGWPAEMQIEGCIPKPQL